MDLNTLANVPGDTIVSAMDINNAGQILERGFNRYYIFTPILEPASAAVVLGAAGLLRWRRGMR